MREHEINENRSIFLVPWRGSATCTWLRGNGAAGSSVARMRRTTSAVAGAMGRRHAVEIALREVDVQFAASSDRMLPKD